METKKDNPGPAEYQVGNTLYQVTPVYKEDSSAEAIADKIQRLILKETEDKG